MIYALYGSDTYRSRKKLNEIITAYRQKAGDDIDFHRFDARERDVADVKKIMDVPSLFTSKKLVVIEAAFGQSMELMIACARMWKDAKHQHLILHHDVLDASAKKYLNTWEPFLTQSQEFGEMKGNQREAWIGKEAAERGVVLTPDTLRHLAATTKDSWSAVQEIEKIAVTGTRKSVDAPGKSATIFDLGDVFFTDQARAIGMLQRLVAGGEDEFGIFSYLVGRARALVVIKQCTEQKKQIPSWLGIHPFVAKKTGDIARMLTLARCASFLSRFFEEDVRIKTGLSQPADSLMRMLME